jgi:hypothetical protein
MGRRYSFKLFYPATRVEAGFHAVDRYLPTFYRKRTGKPRKSTYRTVTQSALSSLSPDSPIFLLTSLLFPADEHVRAFWPDHYDPKTEWDEEGNEYIPIGGIDVSVRIGQQYALIEYAAVTSSMSDLFERSRAIWKQFDSMLRVSGGLIALFQGVNHRGPATYPILPDGIQAVTLDFFDFVLEERDVYWHIDVDSYASAVLRAAQKET